MTTPINTTISSAPVVPTMTSPFKRLPNEIIDMIANSCDEKTKQRLGWTSRDELLCQQARYFQRILPIYLNDRNIRTFLDTAYYHEHSPFGTAYPKTVTIEDRSAEIPSATPSEIPSGEDPSEIPATTERPRTIQDLDRKQYDSFLSSVVKQIATRTPLGTFWHKRSTYYHVSLLNVTSRDNIKELESLAKFAAIHPEIGGLFPSLFRESDLILPKEVSGSVGLRSLALIMRLSILLLTDEASEGS